MEAGGVRLPDGTLLPVEEQSRFAPGTLCDVVIRAERILLAEYHTPESGTAVVDGRVRALDYQGVAARYFVDALGTSLQVINPIDEQPLRDGATVQLRIRARDCVLLSKKS